MSDLRHTFDKDETVIVSDGKGNPIGSVSRTGNEIMALEFSFVKGFEYVATEAYENAKDKGFWDQDRNRGELIALMHSELSEALEAIRHSNPPDDKISSFSSLEAELADCIIRIMDFGIAYKLKLPEAVLAKMAYNKTRPYKHGKQF